MNKPYSKSTVREYFESIVVAVILALFVRTFAVQAFKIPTGSMENSLLVGDHLLVNKFVFAPTEFDFEAMLLPTRKITRGNVVVFKYPDDPSRDFIKRVIGLPGETIELQNKNVYIDGNVLDERYTKFLELPLEDPSKQDQNNFGVRRQYGPVTIPAKQYFVMGDNRDNSQDSRYWGFLPREYIKGQAMLIYWSYDVKSERRSENIASQLKQLFTKPRWKRLFHQIH